MKQEPLRGFNVRPGAKGNLVVEIDFWADKAKAEPGWIEAKAASMPSQTLVLREYYRRWNVGAGDPYYPEFCENPKRYIYAPAGLLARPVVRGWDGGYRKPACVWMQYSERSDRLVLLHELLGNNIDTHSFRDLVLYLSGQLDLEDLRIRPKAMQMVNDLNASPDPRLHTPWFDPVRPLAWIDYAGPEALQRRSAVEGEHEARCDAEILRAGGVNLAVYYTTPKARAKVIRRLLLTRADGWPGLLVTPQCPLLIEMFGGALTFAKGTKEDPEPEDPRKDGHYDNVHDALGYAVVNTVPVAPPEGQAAPRPHAPADPSLPGHHDFRTPPWAVQDSHLAIKELLGNSR